MRFLLMSKESTKLEDIDRVAMIFIARQNSHLHFQIKYSLTYVNRYLRVIDDSNQLFFIPVTYHSQVDPVGAFGRQLHLVSLRVFTDQLSVHRVTFCFNV